MNSRHRRDRSFGENRTFIGHLVSLLTFPLRLLWGFIVFMVQSWATSRSAQAFMLGLPAVLVIGLFLSGLWAANFTKETRSVGASQAYYQMNLENSPDKPERAEIFARKLVGLKPEEDKYKYQLGEALLASERKDEAFDIISYLAPVDRAGFPDAHVWMASYYLSGQDLQLNETQRREQAVIHLNLAIEADPNNLKAIMFLARIFEFDAKQYEPDDPRQQELMQKSIDCFLQVVDYRGPNGGRPPETFAAVPDLIRVLDNAGMKDEAKIRLANELKEMTKVAHYYAGLNFDIFEIWYLLVAAAVHTGEFEQADDILNEGFQLARTKEDREKILSLKSQVVVEEAIRSFSDMKDREDYRNRLKLLCDAVKINPRNRLVYNYLLEFIATKSNPDVNENWLRDSVVEAEPGIVHVLLGVHEIDMGNLLEGQKHWRIAEQQFSITQFVVSYVIDVAAREYREDFSHPMDMVTLAIELFPDQVTLYRTRGTLLLEDGRYQEAAADFEHLIEKSPRLLVERKWLAKCYEALGQLDKVAEQELIIEEILGSLEVLERMKMEASLEKVD